VIEGSRSGPEAGSGSIPLTDGSGSGSRRPKTYGSYDIRIWNRPILQFSMERRRSLRYSSLWTLWSCSPAGRCNQKRSNACGFSVGTTWTIMVWLWCMIGPGLAHNFQLETCIGGNRLASVYINIWIVLEANLESIHMIDHWPSTTCSVGNV